MYFLIKETLEECTQRDIKNPQFQYVAVLTVDEWKSEKDSFDMGIDIEPDLTEIFTTKAEVNYDSVTGTFCIPDREDISGGEFCFAFALDEKGVVFIDDSGMAEKYIRNVQSTRKWHLPCLARFIYDFLEQIIKNDLMLMENYERRLDAMEAAILDDDSSVRPERVNVVRDDIRDLKIHYEQLLDLGQELEENENNFFKQENIRYFKLFMSRVEKLRDVSMSLRDYTMQIRDLYKAQLDIRQNRIMTILTVVTTIFMPLTLIAGWYGMNFRYMPELEMRWAYPVVIGVSILIIIVSLWFFRKKKWL